jgi:O-antigen/teichoic acid export membrane protein
MLFIPLILTPFIISRIGDMQFGIYTLVLGIVGTFGLLDMSISTSFIKFISEYFHKNNTEKLNHTISTGLFFYIFFTLLLGLAVYLFTGTIVSMLNVPADLTELTANALKISILIFITTNSLGIFTTVLISIQKMYVTSMINLIFGIINFLAVILLLNSSYGLYGIIWSQFFTSLGGIVFTVIYSYKALPQLKISLNYFKLLSLKEMGSFGLQMQVSKLSTFASDKYDELLLGIFSVLNNVTLFNIGNRIVRFGKFFPSQFIVQLAPVAAELNSNDNEEKLKSLFADATKYLVAVTAPLFVFIFVFSDLLVNTWMGSGYETAALIVKILIAGQLVNIALSAPGNSIIPNMGIPKYQMYEGLIHLSINIVLTYFLIKKFGVIGAAFGNTAATFVSSAYVYFVSVKFFGKKYSDVFIKTILPPVIFSGISNFLVYLVYIYFNHDGSLTGNTGRLKGLTILSALALVSFSIYSFAIYKSGFLNVNDKSILKKFLFKYIPFIKS